MLIKLTLAGLLITLSTISCAQKNHEQKNYKTIDEIRSIIDNDGMPSQSLQKLLQACEISHDNSLKTIVEQTQKELNHLTNTMITRY